MESLLGPGLPYCITVAELFYPPSTLFLKESLSPIVPVLLQFQLPYKNLSTSLS